MHIRDLIAGEKEENTTGGKDTQDRAPILEAMQTYIRAEPTSFDVPGHHSRKAAPHAITRLIGKDAFAADSTVQKGLDDRKQRKQVRQRAERLAAELWGASHCCFSTNGTSLSNHSAMLAAIAPGDTGLVSRSSHKSLIGSLILAHVRAVFLKPDFDEAWDIHHCITTGELQEKLQANSEGREVLNGDSRHSMDETKVLVDISGLGVNGYEAEDWLIREKKMTLALGDERHPLLQ